MSTRNRRTVHDWDWKSIKEYIKSHPDMKNKDVADVFDCSESTASNIRSSRSYREYWERSSGQAAKPYTPKEENKQNNEQTTTKQEDKTVVETKPSQYEVITTYMAAISIQSRRTNELLAQLVFSMSQLVEAWKS